MSESNREKEAIDGLIDESRIREGSRMILDTTKPEAVTEEIAQKVISAVLEHIEQTGVSRSSIARAIGVAASTLGQVLSWKYVGQWQRIIIDLDLWLEEESKRSKAPKRTTFVLTGVAAEIKAVADACTMLKTIGLIYGEAGIGKTMALRAVAEDKPGSLFISAEKLAATPPKLLAAIAAELRIGTGNSGRLWEPVKRKLAGTPCLLIIDQVHSLCGVRDDKSLFMLMDLYNATGSPQLWSATIDMVDYLERGMRKGREPLAQIARRIAPRRDLMQRINGGSGGDDPPLYTLDEIRRIFSRGSMRLANDAARYLMRLANRRDFGRLGACEYLMLMAEMVYARKGEVLTADQLRSVHRTLVPSRAYQQMERECEFDQSTPPTLAVAG